MFAFDVLLRQQQIVATSAVEDKGDTRRERWDLIVSDDVERIEQVLIGQILTAGMSDLSLIDEENEQLMRVLSSCIRFANSGIQLSLYIILQNKDSFLTCSHISQVKFKPFNQDKPMQTH